MMANDRYAQSVEKVGESKENEAQNVSGKAVDAHTGVRLLRVQSSSTDSGVDQMQNAIVRVFAVAEKQRMIGAEWMEEIERLSTWVQQSLTCLWGKWFVMIPPHVFATPVPP